MQIEPPATEGSPAKPRRPWYLKLLSLLFVLVCFEIGVILLVFPWMHFWDSTSLTLRWPWLATFWASSYFRGAMSGLGLVNIYISFLEILRLVRASAG
ncbi:MAG: hypothetical protein ABI165_03980 [Bryobacteraceae bacterium]